MEMDEANVNQIEDLQGSITHDIRVSFIRWSGWIMDLVGDVPKTPQTV